MRAGAQARTFFAGFGVSGSMLAAVGAAFVVAGGVLAFDQWPRDLGNAPRERVAVASAAQKSAAKPAPRVVALPAAVPTTSLRGGRRGTAASGRNGTKKRPATTGPVTVTPVAPVTQPVTPQPVTGPQVTPPAPAPNPVADGIESATGSVAGVVRTTGRSLPAVAPVTDAVADTTQSTGQVVGEIVRGLTGGRR